MGTYLKKPKKREVYRFEKKKLTDLPADVDWLRLVKDKKVENEWLIKYPYWFQKGTKKQLHDSRNLEEEARARRTHVKITRKNIVKPSFWKRIINKIKRLKWPFSLQPH